MTWQDHVQNICKKAAQRLYFLILLKRAGITAEDIIRVYISIVRLRLEYAAVIWHLGPTKQQTLTALRIAHHEKTYQEALSEDGIASSVVKTMPPGGQASQLHIFTSVMSKIF